MLRQAPSQSGPNLSQSQPIARRTCLSQSGQSVTLAALILHTPSAAWLMRDATDATVHALLTLHLLKQSKLEDIEAEVIEINGNNQRLERTHAELGELQLLL